MTAPHYTDGPVTIWHGDCIDVMRQMPDASVDAVVTDPPYSLEFMGREWDRHENEDAGFGYYLAGLIDGEGHFRVDAKGRRCEFALKLRDDDEWILRRAIAFIGHGRISHEERNAGGSNSTSSLVIDTKDGVGALCSLLMRYPLRAKKLRDFIVWAEAVDEWLTMERGNRWHGAADRTRLRVLGERIREGRSYSEVAWSGNGFQDWCRQWAVEAYRLLKPGGHLLAFGGTRTFHRLTAGIEDAGFEIRDSIAWLYGSGFPKSLDVSKAIDRMAGAEREVLGDSPFAARKPNGSAGVSSVGLSATPGSVVTAPATADAARWNGWGTALKPAFEPIVVARKPLTGTVAANVLAYGTGALNIDGSRIGTGGQLQWSQPRDMGYHGGTDAGPVEALTATQGRWPANVVLDASQAAALDAQSGVTTAGAAGKRGSSGFVDGYDGDYSVPYGDTGGASRFFKTVDTVAPRFMYTAKAGSDERPVHWVPSCNCETVKPCPSPQRDTTGSTSGDESSWSTSTSGSSTTDEQSLPATTSTTATTTSSTTGSRTSSSSRSSNTSGSTADANSAATSGGSPAASAASSSPSTSSTGTSAPKAGRSTAGAAPVTSERSWKGSVCAVCGAPYKPEAHATVKPVDLMRWLVKLVTPPGGVVLEPFAGSGTTVEAAVLEGFRCVAIEREGDYLPLILQRIRKPHAVGLDFGEWEA